MQLPLSPAIKEPHDAGPPQKRLKAIASLEELDDEEELDDDELLEMAQSQLPVSAPAQAVTTTAQAAPGYPATKPGAWLPSASNTQEALDEAEEIAELVRLANSTVQPDAAGAQSNEQSERSMSATDRRGETSTSYSRASAPSWSGADVTGDTMSVTLKDGRRAFCKLHDSKQSGYLHNRRSQHKTLLSCPIGSLLQQVEQEAFAKAVKASKIQQAQNVAFAEDARFAAPPQQALWVDKYSPQSFFELLSDEQVNREVIKWVKSWDACIHKKSATQSASMTVQSQVGPEQRLLLLSGPPGADPKNTTESSCRPYLHYCKACFTAGATLCITQTVKVALQQCKEIGLILIVEHTCNTAGLGKTTIAHVVARHCGYRPFEINASDDRTAMALQTKIHDAVQMQSVLGKRQMNLVIVDEVDGIAGPQAISVSAACSVISWFDTTFTTSSHT